MTESDVGCADKVAVFVRHVVVCFGSLDFCVEFDAAREFDLTTWGMKLG